jgi:exonuclease SbcC
VRPVLLELQGFGAFRAPTVVDFAETDFFALVGPTGAGKSTVVDAICFALYGSVPRYGDDRLVGAAMSTGHLEAKVRLTFDVGDTRYVAARVVARRGRDAKPTTREARLERLDDGAVLAGQAREMNGAVEALLGLPFEHFTRCVALPQGAFARFLHDKPSDRQDVLVRLLDLRAYERMARLAHERATTDRTVAASAMARLAELGHATEAAVAAARSHVDQVRAALAGIDDAVPVIEAADGAATAADAEAARLDERSRALAAVAVPDAARNLGGALVAARADETIAGEALANATKVRVEAERVRAGLPEQARIEHGRDEHRRHEAAEVDVVDAGRLEAEAQATAAEATDAATRARSDEEAAAGAVEAARLAHAADDLRGHLHDGDVCPVCLQTIENVPVERQPRALRAARDAFDAAAKARQRADANLAKAAQAHAKATGRVEVAAKALARSAANIAALPSPAQLDALAQSVADADAVTCRAREAEASAQARLSAASRERQRVERNIDELANAYHAQRDPLAAAGAPAPVADLVASWESLASWATGQAPRTKAALEAANRSAAEHRAVAAQLLEQAAAVATGAAVAVAPSMSAQSLLLAVARAERDAANSAEALARQHDEAVRLTSEAEKATERSTVAAALANHLGARRFERWLVEEALGDLAAGASDTLGELSGGQYALALHGDEFEVIDKANGDERRSVRTLSGGETFQASLALALALADHLGALAAGARPRLDALFLDEGFGTLDPDSLETVASTIESLGAAGRMVGIVTHVRELAARVPVRYEVRRGPGGATVERVVA